jgi:SPP1 gp7 family putative phage head morphogenesis protein
MADKAHLLTDKMIAELERQLKKYYQSSYNDIKKKLTDELVKMNLAKGMSAAEYYEEARKYNRLEKLEAELSQSIRDTNAEAVKMVNSELTNVFKENWNFQADQISGVSPVLNKDALKAILSGEVNPFKKLAIDELKDRALIESRLTRELTNGILTGESIPQIAGRIRGVVETNLSDSVRIARTETTKVEAAARFEVGKEAQKMGFKVYKRWIATEDERTRPWHREADGQEVPLDEPFIVGGEKLMYPGDENGSAGNVVNCRCTMITISKLVKE